MPKTVEPGTGLTFVELSHPWGPGIPINPGDPDIRIERAVNHATHGVLSQRITTIMHVSTHLNAPLHLVQGGADASQVPLDTFFGNGVVLDLPKSRWEYVTAADLEAARPRVEAGDIVIVNTGWHKKYSDSQEYFGHAPGLAKDAAQWLVDRGVRLFGTDTPFIDHPLATSLGLHRGGPLMKRLPKFYEQETGRSAKADFKEWNPAHRLLLKAGIPTIENVGGDVAEVSGKRCTFHAYPWRFAAGDACVIRLMAMFDPGGHYRIESGLAQ
jgi:kynurenine formamidase